MLIYAKATASIIFELFGRQILYIPEPRNSTRSKMYFSSLASSKTSAAAMQSCRQSIYLVVISSNEILVAFDHTYFTFNSKDIPSI